MRCAFCDAEKESLKVIDSRTCEGGRSIRRRRECERCGKRFTTYERIEQPNRLLVIKKSGDRVPFDREKILAGLEHACYKRPVTDEQKLRIVDEVEEAVQSSYDREVPSSEIGELVIARLRKLDDVAYVRFASVYRKFETVNELVDEAKAVIDARRFEDPEQGRLFTEPDAAQPALQNASGENPAETPKKVSRRSQKPRPRQQPQPAEL